MRDAQTGAFVKNATLFLNDGAFLLPEGRFIIDGLIGSDYTVRVEAPGYLPQSWNGGAPILVPLDGTYDGVHFLLRRSGVISGRVSGAHGPVTVKITSVTTGVAHETTTNAKGVYALEVSPDEWYVVETAGMVYSGIVCRADCNALRDGTRVRPRAGEELTGIDLIQGVEPAASAGVVQRLTPAEGGRLYTTRLPR